MSEIPDVSESEFIYDPNDEFRLKTQGLRQPKRNGYTFWNGQIFLVITDSKYLEDFEFYTHEFTEITLIRIFHEIAQEDNISYEGDLLA